MFEYRSLLDRPTYDPFGWDDVFQGFDRLVRELNRGAPLPSVRGAENVAEKDGQVTVTVDVPGLSEKDVRVDLHHGVLSVSAERNVEPPEGFAPRRRERSAYRVSRSYALGEGFDPEKTTAEIRDGVLSVTVHQAPAAQKKTITVKPA